MKQFWHWMRISAAAMVVVCVCGLVAIWVVPRSVWAVVLPSALLAEFEDERTLTPGVVAAQPTNTASAVAQASAATPTLRVPTRTTGTPSVPSATPLTPTEAPTSTETLTETPTPIETSTLTETPVLTETLTPTETPVLTKTPIAAPTETPMPTGTPVLTETPTAAPTRTPMPTGTPVLTETPTAAPTGTPVPTGTPKPTEVPTLTATPTLNPTQPQVQVMYVCGYERCRDADEYGELIFETEIEVWASSDPNDDRILYTVSHDQEVQVVRQERVWKGPGGLWLELESGGWMSDFWLTAQRCTPANLESFHFTDCLLGEY